MLSRDYFHITACTRPMPCTQWDLHALCKSLMNQVSANPQSYGTASQWELQICMLYMSVYDRWHNLWKHVKRHVCCRGLWTDEATNADCGLFYEGLKWVLVWGLDEGIRWTGHCLQCSWGEVSVGLAAGGRDLSAASRLSKQGPKPQISRMKAHTAGATEQWTPSLVAQSWGHKELCAAVPSFFTDWWPQTNSFWR